jgi:hypothetical protein
MSSRYPTDLDETPPDLVGGADQITPDCLSHVAEMLQATQTALGLRPADQTALEGGLDFGNLADLGVHHSRVESGTYSGTMADWFAVKGLFVQFSANRFTRPPMVFLQTLQPFDPTNNWVYVFEPRLVTTEHFQVFYRHRGAITFPAYPFTLQFDWLAIQPPFGEEADYPE